MARNNDIADAFFGGGLGIQPAAAPQPARGRAALDRHYAAHDEPYDEDGIDEEDEAEEEYAAEEEDGEVELDDEDDLDPAPGVAPAAAPAGNHRLAGALAASVDAELVHFGVPGPGYAPYNAAASRLNAAAIPAPMQPPAQAQNPLGGFSPLVNAPVFQPVRAQIVAAGANLAALHRPHPGAMVDQVSNAAYGMGSVLRFITQEPLASDGLLWISNRASSDPAAASAALQGIVQLEQNLTAAYGAPKNAVFGLSTTMGPKDVRLYGSAQPQRPTTPLVAFAKIWTAGERFYAVIRNFQGDYAFTGPADGPFIHLLREAEAGRLQPIAAQPAPAPQVQAPQIQAPQIQAPAPAGPAQPVPAPVPQVQHEPEAVQAPALQQAAPPAAKAVVIRELTRAEHAFLAVLGREQATPQFRGGVPFFKITMGVPQIDRGVSGKDIQDAKVSLFKAGYILDGATLRMTTHGSEALRQANAARAAKEEAARAAAEAAEKREREVVDESAAEEAAAEEAAFKDRSEGDDNTP